jgi:hypothetical protein
VTVTFSVDHDSEQGHWVLYLEYDGERHDWIYPANLNTGKVRHDLARLISVIQGNVKCQPPSMRRPTYLPPEE